jgi:hypothetical protein
MQEYVNAHKSEGVSFIEEVGLLYVHGYKKTYSIGIKNGVFPYSNVETTTDTIETNLANRKVAVLGKKALIESAEQMEFIDTDIQKKWTIMADKNEIYHEFVNTADLHSFAYHLKGLDYITPAYRYKITEETDDTWTITGKRKLITRYIGREKRIELVVMKDTYQPVSVTFYDVIDGEPFDATEITRKKNIQFGVSEQQVTFNPEDNPG